MNKVPFSDLSERDSRLMDSLLQQTLRPDSDHDEQQVQKLIQGIRSTPIPDDVSKPPSRRRLSWFPISLAACVLVAVLLVIQPWGSQNSALAAVERTIAAEQLGSAREYEVTIESRARANLRRSAKHTLFVRQRDFAIRITPLLGTGEVWIGGQGAERWIVPRFGPILVGGEDLIRRPLPNKPAFDTPIMQVTSILDRMKRLYKLELRPHQSLADGSSTVLCDQVIGTRIRNSRLEIPAQVELWTDVKSGFARRIELRWDEDSSSESRLIRATAQLVGTPELPSDFFQHSAHHEPNRGVSWVGE